MASATATPLNIKDLPLSSGFVLAELAARLSFHHFWFCAFWNLKLLLLVVRARSLVHCNTQALRSHKTAVTNIYGSQSVFLQDFTLSLNARSVREILTIPEPAG